MLATEGNLKKCPYCAEMVSAEAVKCKHCGESLDPVDRLKSLRDAYNRKWRPSFIFMGIIGMAVPALGLSLTLGSAIGFGIALFIGIIIYASNYPRKDSSNAGEYDDAKPVGNERSGETNTILETFLGDWKERPDIPLTWQDKENLRKLARKLRRDLTNFDWIEIAKMYRRDSNADFRKYM